MGRITEAIFERWAAASWVPLVLCDGCGQPTEAGVFAEDHAEAIALTCGCAAPPAIL